MGVLVVLGMSVTLLVMMRRRYQVKLESVNAYYTEELVKDAQRMSELEKEILRLRERLQR